MVAKFRITISILLSVILSGLVTAQELKFTEVASAELSKDARDGRYGGTYLNGSTIDVIYAYAPKKEPLKIERYSFESGMKFKDVSNEALDENTSADEFAWYVPESMAEKIEPSDIKWIFCNRAFGGAMKFTLGSMKKNYYKGFYVGREFNEEDELKAKTGDIWRVIPGGFKSTSDIEAVKTSDGFAEQAAKYGNPLTAPANSPILAAGIIQEKVRIRNPAPTNGNRVVVMSIDATNFDNTKYNTYILPFSAMTMASGLGQDDHLTNLFVPLNAPSTVAEHKPLLWKDNKDVWCLMRFNDNYEMVDSIFFRSKLMWGYFHIENGMGSTYAIGFGKERYDGWARNLDPKKVDAFQVTKVKDGKHIYTSLFTEDELENKMVVPEGEKAKFSFYHQRNEVEEVLPLMNGDDLIMGRTPVETYLLQISPAGELQAFYYIPAIESGNLVYNHQIMLKGEKIYLMLSEQPREWTNDTKIETSSSTVHGAGVKTTITTEKISKLNEVFLNSQILSLDFEKRSLSNPLIMAGKPFYPTGSFPAIFTQDAIYVTGREKGPKGKEIFIGRIDL